MDRRLVIVGLYFSVGIANFLSGPSLWFSMPDQVYLILIGQSILGVATGGIFSTMYPEIIAGVDAEEFTTR